MNSFLELSVAYMLSHFSCIWLFPTPQTVAHQALLSMGFSGQECWSGLLFPPPGDLPDPKIEPFISCVSCIIGISFPLSYQESSNVTYLYTTLFWKIKISRSLMPLRSKIEGCLCELLHIKPANASNVGQGFIFGWCRWGGWGSNALDMRQEVGSCSGSAAALEQVCQWSRFVSKGSVSALALLLWPVGPFAPLVRIMECFF